jgi:hypothetical protein
VPIHVSKGHTWHSNGTISLTKNPDHRMVFFESDNLQSVYKIIEDTIGISLERIVVENQCRSTREYLETLVPAIIRKLLVIVRPSLIGRKDA